MQTGISRKIGLTVLIILTVLLLILSVLIAIRLQSDQTTPDDSAAGDCDPATYAEQCQLSGGSRTGFVCKCVGVAASNCNGDSPCYAINCSEFDTNQCPGPSSTSTTGTSCTPDSVQTGECGASGCAANQRPIRICEDDGSGYGAQQCTRDDNCVVSTTTTSATTTTSGGGVQNCGTGTWQYSGNCIQVLTGTCDIHRFSGPNDPSQGLACPTTADDDGTQTAGPGTYCPTPQSGMCQQVDVEDSGQGVCSCSNLSSSTTTTTPSTTTTTVSTTTTTVVTTTPPAEELPDTALVSDSADRVLFGVSLLMVGILVIKFDLVDKAMFVAGVQGTNYKQALDFETKRRKKSREKFEGKFRGEN